MHSALIQNRQCRTLALHAKNVVIWTKSEEKRYLGLRAVGNPLNTWSVSASSVVRNFSSGLVPTMKRRAPSTTEKSNVVHQLFSSRTVLNFYRSYIGLNHRYFSRIKIKVMKSYAWNIICGISTTTTVS